MKQTATEWLREKLRLEFGFVFSDNILEQAKEMEKQQICEAYAIGGSPLLGPWEFGEEYYDETFEKKPK